MIEVHQVLNKQGYICAVHLRNRFDVFVAIGGMKNMLPFVQKLANSNVLDFPEGRDEAG